MISITPASLPSDSVSTLTEDKNGQLWVGTLNGLARLKADERQFITYRYDYKNTNSLCGNVINSIAADTNAIWVGTVGGLNVIDVKTGKVTRYQYAPRNPYSLKSKSIQAVYIDPQGVYWIGTNESGISKYDKNLTLFNIVKNSEFDPQGVNLPVVSSFAERSNGDIYVGCDGGGLTLFHTKTGFLSHIPINSRERINSARLTDFVYADGSFSKTLDRHLSTWPILLQSRKRNI